MKFFHVVTPSLFSATFFLFSLLLCEAAQASPVTVLNNNVAINDISLEVGKSAHFKFEVPIGLTHSSFRSFATRNNTSLTFHLSGGTGDGDIYVRLGGSPDTLNYLQRSIGDGNTEIITITAPHPGTYYLTLKAVQSVQHASLIANYQVTLNSSTQLVPHVPVFNTHLPTGQLTTYTITVPPDKKRLTFRLFGGTGDGDLFVKFASKPTIYSFDAISNGYTNAERITFVFPKAGTYYVVLGAFQEVRNALLIASYD